MNIKRAKELLPIIQAFAEGKKIEVDTPDGWKPIDQPKWDDYSEYRIAKEKKWYRVARLLNNATTTADSEIEEQTIQKDVWFIRWLTPRIEYEV